MSSGAGKHLFPGLFSSHAVPVPAKLPGQSSQSLQLLMIQRKQRFQRSRGKLRRALDKKTEQEKEVLRPSKGEE